MTTTVINGLDDNGQRISSMDFEVMAREASQSSSNLTLKTYGQHNIGIRLGHADGLKITVDGPSGQRLGCMGQPGTKIVCKDATSDDVGWLNIGAEITVLGNATNGACNAMAAGKVFIGGSIGARGLTMTKWNPNYSRPELWVLGSAGDSFAEFNCGGIAVICGVHAKNPQNILGYRPCVGMVGGTIYFRGQIDDSYSKTNAKRTQLDDTQWQWLCDNMPNYLAEIDQSQRESELLVREEWQCLVAITPQERALMFSGPMPMAEFRNNHWNKAFGGGDPLRDLAPGLDRSPIGAIETGDLRRKVPYWANNESAAPCTYSCPVHIPTVERLRLLREGKSDEAYELLLRYTPLPASICGAVCPNLCVENCSRKDVDEPVNAQILGQAVGRTSAPKPLPATGKKVAIIGGGPGGMNAAWQLALAGIEAHIFEADSKLGGKLAQVIPWERLPQATWDFEIERFCSMEGIEVFLNTPMDQEKFAELQENFDYVIVAVGTHEPRTIPFPGHEAVLPALDFLKDAKSDNEPKIGKQVVVIGAGNVGCDVACEAYRLGAESVTLVDIQKPLAFGKEKDAAQALGAEFRWPVFTKEVTAQGLVTSEGELIPAETVIVSIGDVPALSFLPKSVETLNVGGADWVTTNRAHLTSDAKILAVGDVEKPGLATNALGAGKTAAEYIIATEKNEIWAPFTKPLIPQAALTITHYAPTSDERTENSQAERCLSCASCRDCHLCETICPEGAISRKELEDGSYTYVSEASKCIACGFCADTCPCGIWVMQPQ